jgi:hypothetical protein
VSATAERVDAPTSTPGRPVRVVFGMTSATERPAAIEQLIDTLGGRPVVLHHDFAKQPGLRIDRPNVHFTPESHVTGWGSWALCLAVVSTIRYALEHFEFDYFQLLSPSCLPLRSVDEFEASLAERPFDGSMDLMDIQSNTDFLMNYGWRMYAPRGSLRQRIMRKARAAYFGRDAERVQPFGLAVLSDRRTARGVGADAYKRLAVATVRLLSRSSISGAPFTRDFRAFVGSLWFGASRELCEDLVRGASDPRVIRYFSRLHIPDELLFATLAGNSGRRIAPAYHFINTFNERGSPRTFKACDLPALLECDAWFARKFPGHPESSVRTALIGRRHPGVLPASAASAPRGTKVAFATVAGPNDLPAVARLAASLEGRTLVVYLRPGADPAAPRPEASNIDYAPAPLTGGFRPTGLNGGLLQLLKYCVECVDFDYLQVLPPDARPTRPIERFERFVESTEAEVHAQVEHLREPTAFARRLATVCAPARSPFARVLHWAEANQPSSGPGQPWRLRSLAALIVSELAAEWLPVRHRALRGLSLGIGALSFGASRDACQHLVRFATDRSWVEYATAIGDDGTVLFGTLMIDGTFAVGPSTVAGPDASGATASESWFVAGATPRAGGEVSEPSDTSRPEHRFAAAGSGTLAR